MLGKRFRRTTSMSQIGPQGCCNVKGFHHQQTHMIANPSPYQQAHMIANPSPFDASVHTSLQPLEVQQPASHPWQAVEIGTAQLGYVRPEPQLVDHAHADPNPSHGVHFHGNVNSNHGFFQDSQHASRIVARQIGLWSQYNHGGSFGVKMEREAVPPVVDFLQICHFCKRRLRPERDIFIYRGDTAFCSEDCRHRQILCDESESLRAKAKSGDSSSETAVAA